MAWLQGRHAAAGRPGRGLRGGRRKFRHVGSAAWQRARSAVVDRLRPVRVDAGVPRAGRRGGPGPHARAPLAVAVLDLEGWSSHLPDVTDRPARGRALPYRAIGGAHPAPFDALGSDRSAGNVLPAGLRCRSNVLRYGAFREPVRSRFNALCVDEVTKIRGFSRVRTRGFPVAPSMRSMQSSASDRRAGTVAEKHGVYPGLPTRGKDGKRRRSAFVRAAVA